MFETCSELATRGETSWESSWTWFARLCCRNRQGWMSAARCLPPDDPDHHHMHGVEGESAPSHTSNPYLRSTDQKSVLVRSIDAFRQT